MATKKQKRAAALAKREQFLEDTRRRGLAALEQEREAMRLKHERQMELAMELAREGVRVIQARRDAEAEQRKIDSRMRISPEEEMRLDTRGITRILIDELKEKSNGTS